MNRGTHADDWSGFLLVSLVVITAVCAAASVIVTVASVRMNDYTLMPGAYVFAAASAINYWYASNYARKHKKSSETEITKS